MLINWDVRSNNRNNPVLARRINSASDSAKQDKNSGPIQSVLKPNALKKAHLKTAVRGSVFIAIVSYLTYQLSKIGWADIFHALPTSPLFYALSIGFVLAPVLAEILSFQTITGKKTSKLGTVFLRKHIFNKAVMNFTGDAYFLQRLSQHDNLGLKRAAIILKDMTFLRAFVANSWIVALVIAAVLLGKLDVLQNIAETSPALVIAVSAFSLSVIIGVLILFRRLTRLELNVAVKVAGIYLTRSIIIGAILISQWSLAIPGAELGVWFIFLLVFSLAKKSPIGGELVFASVIVTLPGLGGDTAAVAAMLIAIAAVTQLFYFLGFLATLEIGLKGKKMAAPARRIPARPSSGILAPAE